MIRLYWDSDGSHSDWTQKAVLSDYEIVQYVNDVVTRDLDEDIIISQYLLLMAFRVAVKEGKIKPWRLEVYIGGIPYKVMTNGRMEVHPDCVHMDLLDKLLDE